MSYHSERRSADVHRGETQSPTLSGEGVDDLLLDSLLSLRKSLVFTDSHLECENQYDSPVVVAMGDPVMIIEAGQGLTSFPSFAKLMSPDYLCCAAFSCCRLLFSSALPTLNDLDDGVGCMRCFDSP